MSDTAKAWIEERRADDARLIPAARAQVAVKFLPRALDALNAVLELHEPISGFEGDPSHWECKVCSDDRGPKPWPCPTVQAIEGAIND